MTALIRRLLERADDDSVQAAAQLAAYQMSEAMLIAERDRLHAKVCASPVVAPALPICAVTGRIAGDKDACGDCDPCGAAYFVPEPVKRLLREHEELAVEHSKALDELYTLRDARFAEAGG